jgi:hypothetical protein
MKSAPILFVLLASLGPATVPSTAPVDGAPDPALKQEFLKLSAAKDTDGLGKLAKSRLADTVTWIVATCEQLAGRPADDTESFAAILREAWKAGIGTGFADKEYDALKNLGANRRDRNDLVKRLEESQQEFEKNGEHKDSLSFQNVVDEMDVVGPGLEQVGDLYRCTQAWILQASACDEPMRGEGADLHKACRAYIKAVETYEKLDLRDPTYDLIAKRKAALVAKGFDKKKEAPADPTKPGAGAGAPGAPGAAAGAEALTPGAVITAAATFDAIPTIDTYLRPNFMDDEITVLWGGLLIKAKGSTATFARFTDGPVIMRAGSSDIRIDTNGDGQADDKLALPGNPVLVKTTIGRGADARPWAFVAQIGGQKDQYQKVEINAEPNDKEFTIYTLPAASIVGTIAGVPVRIIDESMDGIYGTKPVITYGEIGLTKEIFQPEMDSIVIGASKRARPWSELQEIGDKWYKFETDPHGKEIKATSVDLPTGVLKLDFKGPPPTWVVVHGTGPLLQNSYFDLVEGGAKGVVVPAGKYSLYYGEIRKGKKKLIQKTLILPSKGMPTYDVERGKTVTITLGAPFAFDFQKSVDGDKLKVEGRSVVIVGSASERYERTWNCVPRPEVSFRKKGTKLASKGERMGVVQDTDGLQKKGYEACWSPLDIEIELRGEKGAVEVQLSEKKHDIFGKIESDWKE